MRKVATAPCQIQQLQPREVALFYNLSREVCLAGFGASPGVTSYNIPYACLGSLYFTQPLFSATILWDGHVVVQEQVSLTFHR